MSQVKQLTESTSVTLTKPQKTSLREIGSGNVSRGIRTVLQYYEDREILWLKNLNLDTLKAMKAEFPND